MDIIAPWRFWELNSREKEIEYAEAHNIPLKINKETNYSKDKNLWHLSHEGLDLELPSNEAPINKPGFLELGVSPEMAPDKRPMLPFISRRAFRPQLTARSSIPLPDREAEQAGRRERHRYPRYR